MRARRVRRYDSERGCYVYDIGFSSEAEQTDRTMKVGEAFGLGCARGLGTLWSGAVRVAADEYKKLYGKEDIDLIAAVGVGYPSEKMKGK